MQKLTTIALGSTFHKGLETSIHSLRIGPMDDKMVGIRPTNRTNRTALLKTDDLIVIGGKEALEGYAQKATAAINPGQYKLVNGKRGWYKLVEITEAGQEWDLQVSLVPVEGTESVEESREGTEEPEPVVAQPEGWDKVEGGGEVREPTKTEEAPKGGKGRRGNKK